MRNLSGDPNAWEDYLYWQQNNTAMLKRISKLLEATLRNPLDGIGKPEFLKGVLSGCMSRRINEEHRLVYKIYEDRLHVLACRFHY